MMNDAGEKNRIKKRLLEKHEQAIRYLLGSVTREKRPAALLAHDYDNDYIRHDAVCQILKSVSNVCV